VTRARGRRAEPPREIALPVLSRFAGAALQAHGDYEGIEFDGRDFAALAASDASFLGCRFERCGLDGIVFSRARFVESLLADVHAASLDASDSEWHDSILEDARIGAFGAAAATWTSVRVRGGKIDFLDLTDSRCSDVIFEACAIDVLDLGDSRLENVRFEVCTIGELNLSGARCSEVDLAGAELRLLRWSGDLRGVAIGRGQLVDLAPLLAAHVGLEVHD
jgi:uncharacterized protein YjbI with pentapeptide repeats